jgi:ribosomal protein S18 acetylase RimI-like enzyme
MSDTVDNQGRKTKPVVSLRPMRLDEFERWQAAQLKDYVDVLQDRIGGPPASVQQTAQSDFSDALPNGLHTSGAHLAIVVNSDEDEVGTMWWGAHPRRSDAAFIFDVEIVETHRGQGFGRAAMEVVEKAARADGLSAIGLAVSSDNEAARQLYASLGYESRSINMLKPLVEDGK